DRLGKGQYVEATLYQGLSAYDLYGMINWHVRTKQVGITPTVELVSIASGNLCTLDGRWVAFCSMQDREFRAVVRALDLNELWEDSRFHTAPYFSDAALAEHFRQILIARFRQRTLADWLPILLAEKDIAFEVLVSGEEAMEHPQSIHNKAWITIDDPRVGTMKQTAALGRFEAN